MKVAFATTRGSTVDEHFGRAGAFAIWNITPEATEFVELRRVAEGDLDTDVVTTRGMGALHDDAVAEKIEKLADCRIVYFTEIGGPSAAKLVRRGMMPLKTTEATPIADLAASLATTMRTRPAPWMRKALAEEEDLANAAADAADATGSCCDGPGADPSSGCCCTDSGNDPCC